MHRGGAEQRQITPHALLSDSFFIFPEFQYESTHANCGAPDNKRDCKQPPVTCRLSPSRPLSFPHHFILRRAE